jgi:uncharacterized sporulation protein YeaH/YhbH (DUF444 family)
LKKKDLVSSSNHDQLLFLVSLNFCILYLELNIDPERHTHENIPYVELDDETYKKWKEEKKKGSKIKNKCCCD